MFPNSFQAYLYSPLLLSLTIQVYYKRWEKSRLTSLRQALFPRVPHFLQKCLCRYELELNQAWYQKETTCFYCSNFFLREQGHPGGWKHLCVLGTENTCHSVTNSMNQSQEFGTVFKTWLGMPSTHTAHISALALPIPVSC